MQEGGVGKESVDHHGNDRGMCTATNECLTSSMSLFMEMAGSLSTSPPHHRWPWGDGCQSECTV